MALADNRKTVAYARVSSHDQKSDLERQKQVLELFCAQNGWTFEMVSDLGSGMNYHKKGANKIIGLYPCRRREKAGVDT
jgi:predicted site-specific integrase-resolvase